MLCVSYIDMEKKVLFQLLRFVADPLFTKSREYSSKPHFSQHFHVFPSKSHPALQLNKEFV